MMVRRKKPSWLKELAPEGVNPGHLVARKCESCKEWILVDAGGPVALKYDPGVLSPDDLPAAIVMGVPLLRITRIPGINLWTVRTVMGDVGVRPDGLYLAMHRCYRDPISLAPPPKAPRKKANKWRGPDIDRASLEKFDQLWTGRKEKRS